MDTWPESAQLPAAPQRVRLNRNHPAVEQEEVAAPCRNKGERPYIGVLFECCSVYRRLYRSPEASEYRGHCPRCLRNLVVPVGPDGVPRRFLRAR